MPTAGLVAPDCKDTIMSKIIDTNPGLKPMDRGTSIKSNDAVGSGSRPTASSVKIETSDPMEPHTLGRAPSGWLK